MQNYHFFRIQFHSDLNRNNTIVNGSDFELFMYLPCQISNNEINVSTLHNAVNNIWNNSHIHNYTYKAARQIAGWLLPRNVGSRVMQYKPSRSSS